MWINQYVTQHDNEFSFSRKQSSGFAKKVASDFNPIHDEDAKRFCVPGDLLFAYLLSRYGIARQLRCQFAGMVAADVLLHCKEQSDTITISDQQGKEYLSLQHNGDNTTDALLVEPLIRDYVQFSGQNFPHILQPLMQQHGVMIHTQRPLVIYESMALTFQQLPQAETHLRLSNASLQVEGKRGNVQLEFIVAEQGRDIGTGCKSMILSNLQPYNDTEMQSMIAEYNRRKSFFSTLAE